MSGVTWQQCADVLREMQGGRKFDKDWVGEDVAYTLIGASLISHEEQHKHCPTCGTPRLDFSYWRITAAGRMLVEARASNQENPA